MFDVIETSQVIFASGPAHSSAEEILRELAFHVMVERGLADSDARRVVSNEETARRIRALRN
jgi:predicted transcriptional regulator